MSDFPALDAVRTEANCPGRTVLCELQSIEPYVDEMDYWLDLPLRLVHSEGSGIGIEVGPYTLGRADIQALRRAIKAYDETVVSA